MNPVAVEVRGAGDLPQAVPLCIWLPPEAETQEGHVSFGLKGQDRNTHVLADARARHAVEPPTSLVQGAAQVPELPVEPRGSGHAAMDQERVRHPSCWVDGVGVGSEERRGL